MGPLHDGQGIQLHVTQVFDGVECSALSTAKTTAVVQALAVENELTGILYWKSEGHSVREGWLGQYKNKQGMADVADTGCRVWRQE
ncbi:MAG: hypothetical protein QGG54_03670, partial [Gammaproteobacteria bacterium]|nr:hypothetical protein [Gammaproteobacteria bacterium]